MVLTISWELRQPSCIHITYLRSWWWVFMQMHA